MALVISGMCVYEIIGWVGAAYIGYKFSKSSLQNLPDVIKPFGQKNQFENTQEMMKKINEKIEEEKNKNTFSKEHTSGKRKSTREKHENANSRRKRDQERSKKLNGGGGGGGGGKKNGKKNRKGKNGPHQNKYKPPKDIPRDKPSPFH